MGSPVKRFYGTEVLRIDEKSVMLNRMQNGSMIPLLDSHNQGGIHNALGRFKETWIKRGALMGKIVFNQTPNGELAEGMVARGRSLAYLPAIASRSGRFPTKTAP
jgi:hypothetical protein